ncbi:MAG: hypothetical protein KDD60_00795 [Bdellovibrionales bacterium]|nr:hypothetical protein [Bdellovibrionales bacterium]
MDEQFDNRRPRGFGPDRGDLGPIDRWNAVNVDWPPAMSELFQPESSARIQEDLVLAQFYQQHQELRAQIDAGLNAASFNTDTIRLAVPEADALRKQALNVEKIAGYRSDVRHAIAEVYFDFARMHLGLGDQYKAFEASRQAMNHARIAGDEISVLRRISMRDSHQHLAILVREYSEARQALFEMKVLFEHLDSPSRHFLVSTCYADLALVSQEMGYPEEALGYLRLGREESREIFNQEARFQLISHLLVREEFQYTNPSSCLLEHYLEWANDLSGQLMQAAGGEQKEEFSVAARVCMRHAQRLMLLNKTSRAVELAVEAESLLQEVGPDGGWDLICSKLIRSGVALKDGDTRTALNIVAEALSEMQTSPEPKSPYQAATVYISYLNAVANAGSREDVARACRKIELAPTLLEAVTDASGAEVMRNFLILFNSVGGASCFEELCCLKEIGIAALDRATFSTSQFRIDLEDLFLGHCWSMQRLPEAAQSTTLLEGLLDSAGVPANDPKRIHVVSIGHQVSTRSGEIGKFRDKIDQILDHPQVKTFSHKNALRLHEIAIEDGINRLDLDYAEAYMGRLRNVDGDIRTLYADRIGHLEAQISLAKGDRESACQYLREGYLAIVKDPANFSSSASFETLTLLIDLSIKMRDHIRAWQYLKSCTQIMNGQFQMNQLALLISQQMELLVMTEEIDAARLCYQKSEERWAKGFTDTVNRSPRFHEVSARMFLHDDNFGAAMGCLLKAEQMYLNSHLRVSRQLRDLYATILETSLELDESLLQRIEEFEQEVRLRNTAANASAILAPLEKFDRPTKVH